MVRLDPAMQAKLLNEALALHRQGRLDEAERRYERVLKARRDHFDALHLLGLLNHQRGKTGEAYRLIAAALKVEPRSADAHCNLALVLRALGRSEEALAALDQALALAPGHLDALNNRGSILLDLGRPVEAITAFDAVLSRAPRHLQALINRGNARAAQGQTEQALADYDAALALAPGHPLAHYNRGNLMRTLGRPSAAIADYDRTLAVMPMHTAALLNRGLSLAALNRHREAVESYDRILAREPDHADAHFNAALSLLTIGDYRRGFAEYEWRWVRSGMRARKELRPPPWRGETSLANRTVLLHAEQGLGDTIQFVRYVPQLARAGAKIVLEVQPELKALVATVEGGAAVVARGDPLPAFDVHCPLASLPLALRTEVSAVPAVVPYLRVDAGRLERWQRRLQSVPRPRIALAWAGRTTHANDRNRSIPLALFDAVIATPGRCWLSVQRDLREGDAECLARDGRILHLGGELGDFSDTAAVLELVDLLVCVDTSVAHLAGALGRPAIVLLPFQPDWRWMLDGDRSPWYPTLRLLRQPAIGDWSGAIGQLDAEIARVLAAG
jgi:tetratricopeptide (TPR) repeat protein